MRVSLLVLKTVSSPPTPAQHRIFVNFLRIGFPARVEWAKTLDLTKPNLNFAVREGAMDLISNLNWEAIIQLTLVGMIMIAGPVVIFLLAFRGGDL